VHLQVLVDQLAERYRRRPPSGSKPCKHLLESLQRVSASREPADLRSRRPASLEPVAVRPQRLPVDALRLQLEHLALLPHHEPSSIDRRIEESQRTTSGGRDHPSHRGVTSLAPYEAMDQRRAIKVLLRP
jgi:hypothetical protein